MCSAVQGGFQVTKRICKHKLFQVQKLQKACITRKTDQSGFKRLLWNKLMKLSSLKSIKNWATSGHYYLRKLRESKLKLLSGGTNDNSVEPITK